MTGTFEELEVESGFEQQGRANLTVRERESKGESSFI